MPTRDRGHLVLTPLILAQPQEVVPTAAASEKNGFEGGWEGVEAMDMRRDCLSIKGGRHKP
eukprot:COSAG01_NODE_6620_length_3574_cov_9.974676_2_plen_61_part_00